MEAEAEAEAVIAPSFTACVFQVLFVFVSNLGLLREKDSEMGDVVGERRG